MLAFYPNSRQEKRHLRRIPPKKCQQYLAGRKTKQNNTCILSANSAFPRHPCIRAALPTKINSVTSFDLLLQLLAFHQLSCFFYYYCNIDFKRDFWGGILADVLCSATRGRHRLQFWQDFFFWGGGLNLVLFCRCVAPPWSAVVRAPPVLGHGGRRAPRRAVARARHSGFTSHAEETGENASEAVCPEGHSEPRVPTVLPRQ